MSMLSYFCRGIEDKVSVKQDEVSVVETEEERNRKIWDHLFIKTDGEFFAANFGQYEVVHLQLPRRKVESIDEFRDMLE